ncbi:hypothetical protein IHV25_08755 [Phaeovibrio sulfidiphilus]|uniref:DUF4136 domain-containing protein n=1 Tax=Phaeovibrio sulfidiphilus TaxID=1220600 RepID=A0A8J6YQA2_9PROT|nr:hypothetical protein [Phaeovibrio sulfidiphilus]MBE1237736.1 hypothetical protein [Phaeovibrio sulfidiphilus]
MASRPMMKWFVLTGGLSLAACSGGVTPSCPSQVSGVDVSVRRDHTLLQGISPTTFSIVARSREQAEDPLWAVSVNQVAGLLESFGFRRVFPGSQQPARWRVDVETASSLTCEGDGEEVMQTYRYGWDGTGVQVLQPVGEGVAPGGRTTCRRLSVHIASRGRTLYQGIAEDRGEERDFAGAVPRLARALLEPFPGPVGVFSVTPDEVRVPCPAL